MRDDFEDDLRAARPAEVPPDLWRRLRHAEPLLAAGPLWRGMLPFFAATCAAAALVWVLANPGGSAPEDPATPGARGAPARTDLMGDADRGGFGGNVALNIRLGASPDLTPVSLRPDYDPRSLGLPGPLSSALNLKVELPILNTTNTN